MHAYVLGWITTLGLLLFTRSTALLRVSVFFAVWDILDILCYRLYFVFVKSRSTQWTSATIRRTLVMATANVIEIVLGFAILYARIGDMRDTQFPDRCVSPISDLYFSITTITTVGFGDFVPADDPSRLLDFYRFQCASSERLRNSQGICLIADGTESQGPLSNTLVGSTGCGICFESMSTLMVC